MSISDKITRLQNAKISIANAITAKGGTVGQGDGFEDFASDISEIPGSGIVLSGEKLKYIIPLSIYLPIVTTTTVFKFYTGLSLNTESLSATLINRDVNTQSGYQSKSFSIGFHLNFSRGQNTAGYVFGHTWVHLYSSVPQLDGVKSGPTLWSDFSNPITIENKIQQTAAMSYVNDVTYYGYLLVFDTAFEGNAEIKQITDAGMSTYFSLTRPS